MLVFEIDRHRGIFGRGPFTEWRQFVWQTGVEVIDYLLPVHTGSKYPTRLFFWDSGSLPPVETYSHITSFPSCCFVTKCSINSRVVSLVSCARLES